MKTIGLIGGMSWESSLEYYQIMNEEVRKQLGGFHSAKILLDSLNFAEVEALQHQNNWKALEDLMVESAQRLENAGAELLILGTNTMHLCCAAIQQHTSIPFLHIAEATGQAIKSDGIQKVLLLGTHFTMQSTFYQGLLLKQFGIETIVPIEADQNLIHEIIYNELVHGILKSSSKKTYIDIIEKYRDEGIEGVVLGCTEIPLLIKPNDVSVAVYNTTKLHAIKAVSMAIAAQ